jgi:redox-regulated HSP33 family molecular chaperone
VKSVQQLGDHNQGRACLTCDFCGSQYFGRQ